MTMLTGSELIKSTVTAASKAIKPISLWGSTLKVLVITHPVAFLALTGSSIIGLGAYTFTAQKIDKRNEAKSAIASKEKEMPV